MGGSKFREENGAAGSGRAQAGGGSNEDSSSSSMAEGRSGEALHLDNSGSLSPSPCPCPSPSPSCCDTDDDDPGPKPAELYGKFTWRIENFSQISKRELRSNVFEVGGYKWYILVYPQGCDVCNHLSLFLCVADYDKLLPGWSHFAQFTIAVVNKDPKKSKYSDTLHRFCKKEHDWGWKKFMEVSKVLDGFTMADTLVIKAQVQVIRENPNRPFRCLDCHYRRELVRVYITNVEAICRRFVEEKREKLGKFIEDTARWSSFRTFWLAVEENVQRRMSREKTDVILKQVVKRFFNEKEVTSTLVMDALYSGYKSIEYQSTNKKGKIKIVELEDISTPVVCVEKDMFVLADDVLSLLERAATEVLPPLKDDKGPQNRTKDGSSGDEFGRDSVDCDEKCLTELGRRTVEMFVLAHLFSTRVEVAYREAIALRRQEELIREEEAASQAEIELRAKREAADKEKRSKKKQAKQRRSIRKEKDRVRNDKRDMVDQHQHQQEILSGIRNVENCSSKESSLAALEILETPDESEFSGLDKTDNVVGVIGPETEDGDVNRVDWDRDSSEAQQDMEASFSGAVSMPAQSGRIGKKHRPALDDSSSTCSTDSLPSVAMNGSYKVSNKCESLSTRGKYKTDNERSDKDNYTKADCSAVSTTASETKNIIESLQQHVQSLEQTVAEKDQEIAFLQRQLSSFQHQIGGDKSCKQQDMTANHCNARTSGLSVSKSVDDDKGKSLGMQADESAVKHSSSSCSVELQARCSIPKDLPTESGNFSGTNFTLNNLSVSIKQLENPPVESCNLNGSGLSLNKPVSVSLKQHLQKPSSPKRSGEMDNTVQIITTGSVQIETSSVDSHSARGTIAYHDRSRPSSAPLFPVGPRPNISAALTRPIPSLSRSSSARLDNGVDPMTFSSSSLSSTPPVSPSYRNAAAGKMRGSSTGHFPRVVSSAAQTGVCVTQPLPSSSLCTTTTTSSNPYKVCVSCPESLGRTREDASPSSSTSISSHVSTPRASMLNGSASDQAAISGVEQGGTQMGFMFGTIMRDPLNRNTSQELAQDVDVAISGVEDISCKQDQQQQQQRFLGQYVQQQRMSQNLRASQVHSEQDNLDNRFPHYSQDELRTRQSYKNIDAANSNKRAVPGLSEEFPHLDIINYLLDEEQNMGKAALSAMLHNPHEQKLNRQFSLPVLQGPKFDLHNSGRFDRYAPEEDGSFQLACSSDWCPPGLSESMQILPPYVHSSPTQYIDQHGGPLEEVPSHNWSMYSADMPGNSIMNNGHGPVGPPMGYSMQDHHISAGHCSNFTVGPNGYAYF